MGPSLSAALRAQGSGPDVGGPCSYLLYRRPCSVKTTRTTRHCCTAAHRASPAGPAPACCVPSAFLAVGRRRRRGPGPNRTASCLPARIKARAVHRIPCHAKQPCLASRCGASRAASMKHIHWFCADMVQKLQVRRPHFYTITLKLLMPRILDLL